jgi:predicted DsbA family dithiol-disulfide isomerase
VFTDIMCGWSTLALHRFYRAREAAGLDGRLHPDPQLFLLEDVNRITLNARMIEPEKAAIAALEPGLGFTAWHRGLSEWPVTSLPASEAVHAAKEQSATAAEELDMALRLAFWRDGRCISMRHEILDVAAGCPHVDVDRLREAFDAGRARGAMMRTYFQYRGDVQGSPHFFLADGSDVANPGLRLHEEGPEGASYPVVDDDDPGVYVELVRRAAEAGAPA